MPGSDKCFKEEIKEKNGVQMRVGRGENNLKKDAREDIKTLIWKKKKSLKKKKKSTDRWVSRGRGFRAERKGGQRSKEENLEGLKTKH